MVGVQDVIDELYKLEYDVKDRPLTSEERLYMSQLVARIPSQRLLQMCRDMNASQTRPLFFERDLRVAILKRLDARPTNAPPCCIII